MWHIIEIIIVFDLHTVNSQETWHFQGKDMLVIGSLINDQLIFYKNLNYIHWFITIIQYIYHN